MRDFKWNNAFLFLMQIGAIVWGISAVVVWFDPMPIWMQFVSCVVNAGMFFLVWRAYK